MWLNCFRGARSVAVIVSAFNSGAGTFLHLLKTNPDKVQALYATHFTCSNHVSEPLPMFWPGWFELVQIFLQVVSNETRQVKRAVQRSVHSECNRQKHRYRNAQ